MFQRNTPLNDRIYFSPACRDPRCRTCFGTPMARPRKRSLLDRLASWFLVS